MHLALQTIVGQLTIASLYALVGVGFVTIFRASRVFNLAQGSLAVIGGYLLYSLAQYVGLNFGVAVAASIVASGVLGVLIYLALFRPLFGQRPILLLMTSLGLDIALSGVVILVWGTDTLFEALPGNLKGTVGLPGGITMSKIDGIVFLIAVILIGAFSIAVRESRFGLAMRAASENPLLATYRGVPVGATASVAWAVAVGFGAVAGIAYGASSGLSPVAGQVLGASALPAVVIGGIDSIGGALIGSLVLAEVQGFAVVYVGGQFSNVVGYLILLAFLLARPTGLFGRVQIARL